jgi:hypothetical protein
LVAERLPLVAPGVPMMPTIHRKLLVMMEHPLRLLELFPVSSHSALGEYGLMALLLWLSLTAVKLALQTLIEV